MIPTVGGYKSLGFFFLFFPLGVVSVFHGFCWEVEFRVGWDLPSSPPFWMF